MNLWQQNTSNTTRRLRQYKYALMLLLAVFITGQALAQYEIRKHSINSGGNVMTGGSYEIKSSIGQVDADRPSSAGDYTLNSGFWHPNNDLIFKNKF